MHQPTQTDQDVELLADALHSVDNDATAWDYARAAIAELRRTGRLAVTLPDHLRGDGPCRDCGTADNICWFTDSVFWNHVMGGPAAVDDPGGIVCVPCFVARTSKAGYQPTGWRLLPEWPWRETTTPTTEGDHK